MVLFPCNCASFERNSYVSGHRSFVSKQLFRPNSTGAENLPPVVRPTLRSNIQCICTCIILKTFFLYTACLSCDVCRNPHHPLPSPHSPFHCCTAKMAYLFDFCHFIYFMSCKHIYVQFVFSFSLFTLPSFPFLFVIERCKSMLCMFMYRELSWVSLNCYVCVCACVSACMHVCVLVCMRTVAFILYKHVHQVCEEKIYA